MGFIHGATRHAELLFPERLDAYIAAKQPVRFLAAFVDHLTRTTLGFQRATPPPRDGLPTPPQICCSATFPALSTVSGRVVAWHRRRTGRWSCCGY